MLRKSSVLMGKTLTHLDLRVPPSSHPFDLSSSSCEDDPSGVGSFETHYLWSSRWVAPPPLQSPKILMLIIPTFFSNAKLNGYIPPNKEDCGQPGFTMTKRKHFSNILCHSYLKNGMCISIMTYMVKERLLTMLLQATRRIIISGGGSERA